MANYNPKFDTTEHNAIILNTHTLTATDGILKIDGSAISSGSSGGGSGLPLMGAETSGQFLCNDGADPFWSVVKGLPITNASTNNMVLQVVNTAPTWVSLKTINNQNIIGTGDLTISGIVAEGWDI